MTAQASESPVSFIYFDVGGVLLHYVEAERQFAKELGISFETLDEDLKRHSDKLLNGGLNLETWWLGFAEEYGLDGWKRLDFVSYLHRYYEPIWQTHELVYRLSDSYPLGLLTNVSRGVHQVSYESGLIPVIDYAVVVKSFAVALAKPEPTIYALAATLAQVEAKQILFIDDDVDNVAGAKACGFQTLHFDELQPEISVQQIEAYLGLI